MVKSNKNNDIVITVNKEQHKVLNNLRARYQELNTPIVLDNKFLVTQKVTLTWHEDCSYSVSEEDDYSKSSKESIKNMRDTIDRHDKHLEDFCNSCDDLADEIGCTKYNFFELFIVSREGKVLVEEGSDETVVPDKEVCMKNSEVVLSSVYDDQALYIPIYDTGHGDQEGTGRVFNLLYMAQNWVMDNKNDYVNLRIMVVKPGQPYTILK